MPAPVTHIVLALSILPLLPDKKEDEFLIGTSFPDIRYTGVLTRKQTHHPRPTWNSIVNQRSSFEAGMEFHALVDQIHDRYMTNQRAYDCISGSSRFKPYILKFYEDMILYEYCDCWNKIVGYFEAPAKNESNFSIKNRDVTIWHSLLRWYLGDRPDIMRITTLLVGRGFALPGLFKELLKKVSQKSSPSTLHNIILTFYQEFTNLLL